MKDFATRAVEENKLALYDRCTQFALVAAREAIAQSKLDFRNGLGARTATAIIMENADRKDALTKYQRLCDMAAEMGIPGQIDHPRGVEAYEKVGAACAAAGSCRSRNRAAGPSWASPTARPTCSAS